MKIVNLIVEYWNGEKFEFSENHPAEADNEFVYVKDKFKVKKSETHVVYSKSRVGVETRMIARQITQSIFADKRFELCD